MNKCDFCSRSSGTCDPNSKECKQATERYFQYSMAQIRLIDADELIKKMQARYAEIEKEYTYYDSYVQ